MHERHKLMKTFLLAQERSKEESQETLLSIPSPNENAPRKQISSFRRFYLLCNFKQAGSGV